MDQVHMEETFPPRDDVDGDTKGETDVTDGTPGARKPEWQL